MQRILAAHYPTGQAKKGRRAYRAIVLLKMYLLQTWYNLSDYAVEKQVNDSLSCMRLCGLQLEDDVPVHSVVCRFRKALTAAGAWEKLLETLNAQRKAQGSFVEQGSIVDASVTPTARKPKGKASDLLEAGQTPPLNKAPQAGVDQQARWVKKGGKLQYGYQRHYLADAQDGLVLAVHTTAAHPHDSQHLATCLSKVSLPRKRRILADKGYSGQPNESLLRSKGYRSGIQRKASRGKPLSVWAQRYNKLIGSHCYKIERVFGSIKC